MNKKEMTPVARMIACAVYMNHVEIEYIPGGVVVRAENRGAGFGPGEEAILTPEEFVRFSTAWAKKKVSKPCPGFHPSEDVSPYCENVREPLPDWTVPDLCPECEKEREKAEAMALSS